MAKDDGKDDGLKPCPHCGSEAHTPTVWYSSGRPIPQCKNPDCLAEARSVEAWNRREPDPARSPPQTTHVPRR
jgi:hypothetical protein